MDKRKPETGTHYCSGVKGSMSLLLKVFKPTFTNIRFAARSRALGTQINHHPGLRKVL